MTRDQTIATLILHGWEPYAVFGTLGGMDVQAAIWNRDTRWTIRWAPPSSVQWVRIAKEAALNGCDWSMLEDRAIEVFGNVYDHEEVGLGGLAQLQQSVAIRNARLDAQETP
jgi:hypothetical protein